MIKNITLKPQSTYSPSLPEPIQLQEGEDISFTFSSNQAPSSDEKLSKEDLEKKLNEKEFDTQERMSLDELTLLSKLMTPFKEDGERPSEKEPPEKPASVSSRIAKIFYQEDGESLEKRIVCRRSQCQWIHSFGSVFSFKKE